MMCSVFYRELLQAVGEVVLCLNLSKLAMSGAELPAGNWAVMLELRLLKEGIADTLSPLESPEICSCLAEVWQCVGYILGE